MMIELDGSETLNKKEGVMKKLILTAAILILGTGMMLAGGKKGRSNLELRLWDNSPFEVELDHRVYGAPMTVFNMEGLRAGNHHLRVIKRMVRPNGHLTQVLFEGTVFIPASSNIDAIVTRTGRFDMVRVRPRGNSGYNSHHNGNNSYGTNSHYGAGSSYGTNSHLYIMNDASFLSLRRSISDARFESDRMTIARQAIGPVMVSSAQVLELMNLMTFESSRLELAKYAYDFTHDKHNFYLVNNGFKFSSSISSLNQYINSYGY
jgi:hypothetical protein